MSVAISVSTKPSAVAPLLALHTSSIEGKRKRDFVLTMGSS